jgi:hypothetical protein
MRQIWKRTSTVTMCMALSFLIWESAAWAAEKPAETPSELEPLDRQQQDDSDKETSQDAPSAEPATDDQKKQDSDKNISENTPSAEQAAGDQEKEKKDNEAGKKILEWFKRINFSGDLRYRFEMIDEAGKDFRYRNRLRARLGVLANIYGGVDVGIGFGGGNSEDPVSTNQTLGEAFSTKPLWLDLAYVDWHPDFAEGLHLIGGKMRNVFYRFSTTELLWDPDLRPEGIALTYKNRFGSLEPFFNSSLYWVEERSDSKNSLLLGAQAGLTAIFLAGKLHFTAGAAYYDYTAIKGYPPYFKGNDGNGNTLDEIPHDNDTPDDPEDDTITYVYVNDYNEVNLFAQIGGKIKRFPWAVFGDFVINVAAADENIGWAAGASFGHLKEALDFKFRYYYRVVEADAVVGLFNDSDFNGGSTDARGHEANFALQIVKNIQFALTYFYNQSPLDDMKRYQRGQIDFKFRF